jgi:hypothetical protein
MKPSAAFGSLQEVFRDEFPATRLLASFRRFRRLRAT